MSSQVRFCGQCGEGLAEGAKFCGACGWKIPAAKDGREEAESAVRAATLAQAVPSIARIPKPKPQAPVAPPVAANDLAVRESAEKPAEHAEREDTQTQAIPAVTPVSPVAPVAPDKPDTLLGSVLSWTLVWVIAWLPVGLFMGYYWTTNYARNQELYNSYGYLSVSLGNTIAGAAIAVSIAGVFAGLLAGGVLRWTIPQINSQRRRIPVLMIWLLGWGLALGFPAADFILGGHQSDDTLLGLMFVAAPVTAIFAAQVAINAAVPKATKGQRLWATLGWGLAAIVGFVTFILVTEFL